VAERRDSWAEGVEQYVLVALAAAGEDGSAPGTEVVKVDADSPDDKEAQEWQRLNILRRDTDAEDMLPEYGKKLYTWHHATLRLSAALAFGKNFRPLVRIPPFITLNVSHVRVRFM
jgi:hypothetical protein